MARLSVREKIVAAAAERFHALGYNACGVQEIVDAAGVPKGSFYNYFKAKELLAREVLNNYWVDAGLDILADKSTAPLARLRRHFHHIASRYKADSSNNTIFADRKGEIAFLTPQFIPRRDDRFDYTKPVDGSNPTTDWRGLLPLSAMPNVVGPPNGWVFNTNDWPYSAAGRYSPKRSAYPATWTRLRRTCGESMRLGC
jgi:AcrR family transcriptional regulator